MHILYKCVCWASFCKAIKNHSYTGICFYFACCYVFAMRKMLLFFSFTFSLGYVRMFVCGCAFGVENEKRTNKWNCLKRDHMVPLEPQCSSVCLCVWSEMAESKEESHRQRAQNLCKKPKMESDVIMTACAGGHSVRRSHDLAMRPIFTLQQRKSYSFIINNIKYH